MRIPRTVRDFRKWARKPRVSSERIFSIGSCVAVNCAHDTGLVEAVLRIVAEECAIRWEKAARR